MASYIQLEPSSFRGIISDDKVPKYDGTDVSFYATSSFIYTLFFIAIVGAAFYEYILVGVYRMEASENGIRRSNETFRRTTWGLLISILGSVYLIDYLKIDLPQVAMIIIFIVSSFSLIYGCSLLEKLGNKSEVLKMHPGRL
jgi:hypothetical protein